MSNSLFEMAEEQEGLSREQRQNAAWAGMASSFSSLAGSYIDYANLRSDIANLRVQGSRVELQAKQQANQLREQFVKSMGTYMYGAAKRGVAVSSANVQSNLQRSSEALGKDIQRMEQNAALQANALRAQGKIAKHAGQAQLFNGVINGVAGLGMSGINLYSAYKTDKPDDEEDKQSKPKK